MMRLIPSASHTLSRSRYTEDALEESVREGVQQFVILGAGMDTFAFRRPEMLGQLRVFEVDHPATQAFKRSRITELGWEHPAQLHFVPVDFTHESIAAALTRSSYDPQALSFFSWLGVTYYLPREAAFATLRALADIAPAGSTVIFDYMDTDAFVPGRAAKRIQMSIEKCQEWGEPLITGFDPSTLATDLTHLGLRLNEDLSPSDIQGRYFQGRTDGYYACEHVHFAWAVVE
ncbi:MAG: class I SAM-dependent methyltransferase [Desulfocucumaceae bacterium]